MTAAGSQGDCWESGGQGRQDTEGRQGTLYQRQVHQGNHSQRGSEYTEGEHSIPLYSKVLTVLSPQAPRAEVVLVLSRSRSVTPADRSYDLIDASTYNFINSSRPPKILESPLDSKSLSAGSYQL